MIEVIMHAHQKDHTVLQDHQIIRKIDKYKVECICSQCSNIFVASKYDAKKSKIGHLCPDCKDHVTNLKEPDQAKLLDVFGYDPQTGKVTYKKDSRNALKGVEAGYKHHEGYKSISIGKKEYLLHRVIWMMQTGVWPDQVDHIDHDRSNNRWSNLREVVSRDNQLNTSKSRNNTSGVTGVRILPSGRYCSYIMVHRKQISLGTYDDLEDAILARKAGELQYGFHINHGA